MRVLWEKAKWNFDDCAEAAIQHWLYIHELMLADLPHIRSVTVVHFEQLALGDTQGLQPCTHAADLTLEPDMFDELQRRSGLRELVTVAVKGRTRREFHGSRAHPVIDRDMVRLQRSFHLSIGDSLCGRCTGGSARTPGPSSRGRTHAPACWRGTRPRWRGSGTV